MPDSLYLKFDNLSRPVALINCRHLIDHFPLIFSGWEISELPEATKAPVITLSRDVKDTYWLHAEWLEEPLKSKNDVDAICGLVARILKARVMEDINLLCLHGAAAEFGGALVIFPNKFRAGKSVLSACIAAAGYRLYCDDVLPISLASGLGIAPGIAPRLRIPYPENLSDSTRRFIESRTALKNNRYLYLDIRGETLAARHNQAPIGAFVFLERSEGVEPSLEAISESEVLRHVVWQNFAREVEAPSILGRLGQIVNSTQRYRMHYDRADDAVALLADTFREQKISSQMLPPLALKMRNEAPVTIDIPDGYLLRKDGISEINRDEETFLADASGAAIHHLNPVGSAIWGLLAEPITTEKIVELLLKAFPEIDRTQVENDVRKLIKTLRAKNLVLRGPRRVGSVEVN